MYITQKKAGAQFQRKVSELREWEKSQARTHTKFISHKMNDLRGAGEETNKICEDLHTKKNQFSLELKPSQIYCNNAYLLYGCDSTDQI